TVTVTDARVSRDLSTAILFVLPVGEADQQKETMAGLQAAAPFVRGELGERLRLRKLPTLRFQRDETIQHAARIERLLHEVFPPVRPDDPPEADED
ncbi:MAG: 30S ribosome-binding factor RbfA, partial [Longimicrobiales bacterium]